MLKFQALPTVDSECKTCKSSQTQVHVKLLLSTLSV